MFAKSLAKIQFERLVDDAGKYSFAHTRTRCVLAASCAVGPSDRRSARYAVAPAHFAMDSGYQRNRPFHAQHAAWRGDRVLRRRISNDRFYYDIAAGVRFRDSRPTLAVVRAEAEKLGLSPDGLEAFDRVRGGLRDLLAKGGRKDKIHHEYRPRAYQAQFWIFNSITTISY